MAIKRRIVAGAGAGSRVLGVSRLRRTLRAIPGDITAPVRKVIADGAEEIQFGMLQRVRVRFGFLAEGIRFKVSGDGLSAKIGFFGKKIMRRVGWRAIFIEFGTKNAPAFEFMLPAMRESRDRIIRDIDRAVDRALTRAGRVGR